MSSTNTPDPIQSSSAVNGNAEANWITWTIGTKSKKHKRRKGGGKGKENGNTEKLNGTSGEAEHDQDEAEVGEPRILAEPEQPPDTQEEPEPNGLREVISNGVSPGSDLAHAPGMPIEEKELPKAVENLPGYRSRKTSMAGKEVQPEPLKSPQANRSRKPTMVDEIQKNGFSSTSADDTETRLDALARERAALRDEVTQLRKALQDIQGKHEEELSSFREQLEDTQGEKEHAESQYGNLLGKVNQIKSQLGERLKAYADDLAQARSHIEELEEQKRDMQEQNTSREAELAQLAEVAEQRSKELSSLRNRMNLSQQNWTKERDDLIQREAYAREEFDGAKQAMSDWEVLAMEERSIREGLVERVADLEEQVSNHRTAHEKAAAERDLQSLTVDGLQRALQEIQEARKRELREVVENSQAQIESLQKQLQEVQVEAAESKNALELAKTEIERTLPFEMEVREKNLLIGKLRHEAVILNDHLTKALRYLKKGKPEDNIDKQLVTNHFLHFLALERADPKKFQILQIIAALLGWTDDQREQAGLARPGASNPNLRTPISPWHRTPSTPALSSEFFPDSGGRKESLAGLWSDFLEQEAQEGARSSRSPSISSLVKPPS
ncbi:MAG: hypothetical protein Q9187_000926 [Circinaria calcarea]